MIRSTNAPTAAARRALAASGLVTLLVLWWLGTWSLQARVPLAATMAPDETLMTALRLLQDGQWTEHVVVSLRRVLVGLSLALAVGVPLGLAVGASRHAEAFGGLALPVLRMISPLSWMPLAVMVSNASSTPALSMATIRMPLS